MGLLVWEEQSAGIRFPHAQEPVTNATTKVFIFLPAGWSRCLRRSCPEFPEFCSGAGGAVRVGDGEDPSPRVWSRVRVSAGVLALLLHFCLVLTRVFQIHPAAFCGVDDQPQVGDALLPDQHLSLFRKLFFNSLIFPFACFQAVISVSPPSTAPLRG